MTETRQPDDDDLVVLTFKIEKHLADDVRRIAAERGEPLSAALRRSMTSYRRNYAGLLPDREKGRGGRRT